MGSNACSCRLQLRQIDGVRGCRTGRYIGEFIAAIVQTRCSQSNLAASETHARCVNFSIARSDAGDVQIRIQSHIQLCTIGIGAVLDGDIAVAVKGHRAIGSHIRCSRVTARCDIPALGRAVSSQAHQVQLLLSRCATGSRITGYGQRLVGQACHFTLDTVDGHRGSTLTDHHAARVDQGSLRAIGYASGAGSKDRTITAVGDSHTCIVQHRISRGDAAY